MKQRQAKKIVSRYSMGERRWRCGTRDEAFRVCGITPPGECSHWHDDDDYYDDWDGSDYEPTEEEEHEEWLLDECGRLPEHLGGGCMLAGSEHCDFECPYRDLEVDDEEVEVDE